ncbi:MAG: signal peptidase I [Fidelibacterota bacterium]
MTHRVKKIFREFRSLAILILIALLLKVTIVEAYIVPTGSMEDTIMTGDFLIGNRFVYGMRSPDWIGIPYTDKGFDIPFMRFPKFRQPERGDVIIFKYPRDTYHKYVKRLIGLPGDTIRIKNRKVFVNSEEFKLPPHGKFIAPKPLPPEYKQRDIFLRNNGNKDYFAPVVIPKQGDVIPLNETTNWLYVVPLMIMDGHEITLESANRRFELTVTDPNDLYRRKESAEVFEAYYPSGNKLTPWSTSISQDTWKYMKIDGVPVTELSSYTVEQNYYWAMGDNRDDSLDSRYWGFVPETHLLGEALFVYFSLDLDHWTPRLSRIGTIIR